MIEEFDQCLLSMPNRLNSYLPFPDNVSIRNSIIGGHTQSRTGMTLQSADFLHTIIFITIISNVCVLDFVFTLYFYLGGYRQVSTRSSSEASLGVVISEFTEFDTIRSRSFLPRRSFVLPLLKRYVLVREWQLGHNNLRFSNL